MCVGRDAVFHRHQQHCYTVLLIIVLLLCISCWHFSSVEGEEEDNEERVRSLQESSSSSSFDARTNIQKEMESNLADCSEHWQLQWRELRLESCYQPIAPSTLLSSPQHSLALHSLITDGGFSGALYRGALGEMGN